MRSDEVITFRIDLEGAATNGSDYVASGHGEVHLLPGTDFASVTIQLVDEGVPEAAETIELSLAMPTNCVLGNARHTVEIRSG